MISRIFDISRRSLATYQRALDITSHNIANASNPFYSRQRVSLSSEKPEMNAGFVWGTGVKLDQIQRIRNGLIDSQLRVSLQNFSSREQQSNVVGQIEQLFSEPSELGISSLINSFFSSWTELSVSPNSSPLRANVINSAQKLSTKVKSIYDGLEEVKTNILSDAKDKVTELNDYLKQIQDLNSQIFKFQSIGQNANDLMDHRDRVLDEVSKLANVNISYDSENSAVVSVGSVFGADRYSSAEFELREISGQLSIVPKNQDTALNLSGGSLNALTEIYSSSVPSYLNKIDTLISTLMEKVNGLHSSGYSLENPPATGINFFQEYTSGLLKINPDILSNTGRIAVSSDGTAGNGEVAMAIADLNSAGLIENVKLSDFYSNLINDIANTKVTADQLAESDLLVMQQLEVQKASVSGVSIDEEMTNIIKFQRAYEASAKLIKVADEMLETILSMV